jgi:hypothetical protein
MAVTEFDPYKLSSPRIFLLRMLVFVTLALFLALILYEPIVNAFMANPGLNALILGVLVIGTVLAFRQVVRIFPEVRWVNGFRVADPGLTLRDPPVMLAPMAALLGDRLGAAPISTMTMRSILDSIGTRLDEARDIGRYLTGLLVFLGLLGTFWGLLETVSSIGGVIQSLNVGNEAGVIFEDLKNGLAAPLAGMGISFSSSLFGLAGSLVLGFLDLQAGQAQNRFHNELEDWLAAVVASAGGAPVEVDADGLAVAPPRNAELTDTLERLTRALQESGAPNRGSAQAMAHLAEGIQGLVHHMRSEQQMIRDWVEAQSAQQDEIKRLLERFLRERAGMR